MLTLSDIVLVRPLNLLITSDVFTVLFMTLLSILVCIISVDMFIVSATSLMIDFNFINDSFIDVDSLLNLTIVISLTNSNPCWNTPFWNIPANTPNAPTFIVSDTVFILPTILFFAVDILIVSDTDLINALSFSLNV